MFYFISQKRKQRLIEGKRLAQVHTANLQQGQNLELRLEDLARDLSKVHPIELPPSASLRKKRNGAHHACHARATSSLTPSQKPTEWPRSEEPVRLSSLTSQLTNEETQAQRRKVIKVTQQTNGNIQTGTEITVFRFTATPAPPQRQAQSSSWSLEHTFVFCFRAVPRRKKQPHTGEASFFLSPHGISLLAFQLEASCGIRMCMRLSRPQR